MNITINDSDGKESKKKTESKAASELRQDLVSGDWVVIATARAKRPDQFIHANRISEDNGIESCLFEDPIATGQEPDVLMYERADGDWSLRVFPNKYPAFTKGKTRNLSEGPYTAMTGHGFHEIVVTRDHYRQLAVMNEFEVAEVFDAYQDRYLEHMNKKDVNYITIFHNHGKEAGASIPHPHSQIMAIPVISPYVKLELDGAAKFHKSNRHCVFCTIIEHEIEVKKRVLFENDEFIAYCPFASRTPFEIHVMPKNHNPYFERITDKQKIKLAEVFSKALGAIYKALDNPPYNFYIHTAPCDGEDHPHYHWHIEILPVPPTPWAGFELETGIEVSAIQPEVAAEYLRKQLEQ